MGQEFPAELALNNTDRGLEFLRSKHVDVAHE